MADNQPTYKVVNVLTDTYNAVQQIRTQKDMLSENGLQRPLSVVMREIVEFYIQAHKKGQR